MKIYGNMSLRKLPYFITNPKEYMKKIEQKDKLKKQLHLLKIKNQKKERLKKFSPIINNSLRILTLPILKDHCRVRKLKTSGKKSDIINRIEAYEKENNYINWPLKQKRLSRNSYIVYSTFHKKNPPINIDDKQEVSSRIRPRTKKKINSPENPPKNSSENSPEKPPKNSPKNSPEKEQIINLDISQNIWNELE
jgi:hypothetical protein